MKWPRWKAVYVATDSTEIAKKCTELAIPCIVTRVDHTDCLDRAAEVAEKLEKENKGAEKYIIIQGDEPLFNVETLNTDLSPSIINFYTKVQNASDLYDINAVKVVVSKKGKALYFSRYSIPYHNEKTKRTNDEVVIYKQIGVYVFTGETLRLYANLTPCPLENMEGIGLNRLLENDIDVYMRYTQHDSISVDTPEDRDRIISLIKQHSSKQ